MVGGLTESVFFEIPSISETYSVKIQCQYLVWNGHTVLWIGPLRVGAINTMLIWCADETLDTLDLLHYSRFYTRVHFHHNSITFTLFPARSSCREATFRTKSPL